MSGCTEIAKLKSGSENKVTVLEKVEKRVLNFLNCDYYRVSFKDDGGNTVTGFVAANFLTEYTFGGEDTEIKPPATDDFKYDTNVTTVVLVVIVVALVLIAILYITLISTSKKTEKKRKKAKKKRDKDDTEEDEQPEETDNEAEE